MTDLNLLYLSRADVQSVGVTMSEIIGVLEEAFRAHGEGQVEMPPKPDVQPRPGAFIHAMPASAPGLHAVGIKWVSGYPANPQRGLPYISGLIVLNDVETGLPLAIMDCTWITGMRTGAATALAGRYLARPDSSRVGILGCGVQGRTNLEALLTLFPIESVTAYDVSEDNLDRYVHEVAERWRLPVTRAVHPRDAIVGCDIVVTAGPILKQPHATIKAGWLAPGAFASMVDYDSYWDGAAMGEADKFCTDDVSQFEHYRRLGFFQGTPPIYASLGELVTGRKRGRETAQERTMACNLGVALEDVTTASLVYQRAVERDIGVWLAL